MHEYINNLDYTVVALYLVVLIGIGFWVSFVKKKNKDENLFLAGHSLRWPAIGLTMWGTNVGPSLLVITAASGFSNGIAAANFSWYAFVFILMLAMVFAPFYKITKVSTLPEFMGKRFNNTSRELLAWYSLVTILIAWLALTLVAGGFLVSQMMNWPLWLAVSVLVAIGAFFTIAGGLEAIAITNTFQMILLIVVSSGLVITGIVKAGGLSEVYHAVPAGYWTLFRPVSDPDWPWLAIMLGYPVMGIWFWCTDQSMVQSVLGAKNLKQGQLGTNFIGWLKIIDMPLFVMPGILCLVLFPNIAVPEEAYATMVVNLLPNGAIGLVMAVFIAALVSTVDSSLNALSTIFTLDIYVKRFKPKAGQKEIIRTGRVVTFAGAIISVFIAIGISKLEGRDIFILFESILGFLAPPMAAVFLMGVLWKKATPAAANTVLSAGSVISIGIGLLSLLGIPDQAFWPHPLLLSFFIFVGLLVLIFVISKATSINYAGSPLPALRKTIAQDGSNRLLWTLWILLSLVMIALYIFFN
ncbi:MAG: sodium/solute symporter [Bacteroidota bacterium]